MSDDVFGEVVTPGDVEGAARTTVAKWLPTYLARMERRKGLARGYYMGPKSWVLSERFRKWPENSLPAILIVSSGTISGSIRKQGDGKIGADFNLTVGAIVSAKNEKSAKAMADDYIAAIYELIGHHPSLEGFAESTEWIRADGDLLTDPGHERTIAGFGAAFAVRVESVIDTRGGIREPLEDPYDTPADWPAVEETHLEVDRS